MKKLFTMLIVSAFCTMAYAATATTISVKSVTIPKGGTAQLEVTVNNATSNTAFQFDLTLPKGVSVQSVTMNNGAIVGKKVTEAEDTNARKLKYGVRDANANKYRFLSYDNNNAKLTDGKVVITLAATEEAETATLTGDGFVVVTPEGSSAGEDETVPADITVSVPIIFKAAGVTTFVSDNDLDFSSLENVKAYIVTGYDAITQDIWLARVMDAPAGTPLWVKGPKNETVNVPSVPSQTYYPTTLMIGSATAASIVPADAGYANLTLSPSDGSTNPRDPGYELPKGKAFLHLPTDVTSTVGTSQSITLAAKGGLAYVAPCDLDFATATPEGLKAYTVMGYAKDGTMWIIRTQKASVGTPLYLKGANNGNYTVPSSEVKLTSVNMLKGGATSLAMVDGDNYNFVYIKGDGQWMPAQKDYATWNAGTSYMSVPNTHYTPIASSRGQLSTEDVKMLEAEVICINLRSLTGDDNTTGIQRVNAQKFGDGEWYNLSGQRIDTPAKKGLYIHNGRKVVVK